MTVDHRCVGNRYYEYDWERDEGIIGDERSVLDDQEEYDQMNEINDVGINPYSNGPNGIQVAENGIVVKSDREIEYRDEGDSLE